MIFRELDMVMLIRDEGTVPAGSVGCVVSVFLDNAIYWVEFAESMNVLVLTEHDMIPPSPLAYKALLAEGYSPFQAAQILYRRSIE